MNPLQGEKDAGDGRLSVIRAVIFKEGGWYVAQCLEVDIATQARTQRALKRELTRVLNAHEEIAKESGAEPFAGLPPAPQQYHDQWEDAWQQSAVSLDTAQPISLQAAFA